MKQIAMKKAFLALAFVAGTVFGQEDAPIFHLGFENGFAFDGTTTGVTFNATAEQQGGANAFVPGIIGKAFHRQTNVTQNLVIQGPMFHSTEGTFSFWGQPPDGWKTTEFNGPSFFRFFLPGNDCIFYRIYSQLAVYESNGPQMTQMQDNFLEAGRWRMMTFVYKQGYRCLYVDDVPVFENQKAVNDLAQWAKGERYAKYLEWYGSPVYYDEISTWETPFAAGEVASLYYARTNAPTAATSLAVVPAGKELILPVGYNGFTGARITADDTAMLSHADGKLFVTYRMPLPKDYIAEKTRLGGTFFKSSAKDASGDVSADDCIIVDLSPDGGTTTYRFAANMAGVVVGGHGVEAKAEETSESVSIKVTIPLAGLGDAKDGEWSFNLTRMVRLAGLAKRQAFFTRGALTSYGTLQLAGNDAPALRVSPGWDARARTLTVDVASDASESVTLDAELLPLDHRTVFPADKGVNDLIAKRPIYQPAKISQPLPASGGKLSLTLEGGDIALATVILKDARGRVLFRDAGLAPCTEAGTLQVKYIPSQRKLYTEVTLPSAALLSRKTSAAIELRAAGKPKVLATERIEPFQKVSQETCFDMSRYPLGDYGVTATLLVDGKPSGTLTGTMTKQADPVWVGNKLGEMKEVPKPWTPVRIEDGGSRIEDGKAVSMWGRKYIFKRSLLASSIEATGEELLAGPIRLTAEVNGKPVELTARSLRVQRADKGGMRVNLGGNGALGELSATLDGWIEFDGFQFNRLTLHAPRNKVVTLNNVAIEIPMRASMATLYDVSGYESLNIKAGRIPKEGYQGWAGSCQRVGTEERGIQWTINPDPALLKPGSHTLFITRTNVAAFARTRPGADDCGDGPRSGERGYEGEEAVLLRLVLANQAIQVNGTRWFEFGLQALPFRPYERAMRNYFLGAFGLDIYTVSEKEKAEVIGWHRPMPNLYSEGWSGKWNYLHLTQKALEERRDGYKNYFDRTGTFNALYLNIILGDAGTPEYAYYQNEWSWDGTSAPNILSPTKLIKDYAGHDGKVDYGMAKVNIEAKSYREFYYYYLDKTLSVMQTVTNPPPVWVYYDNSGLVSADNPYAGNPPHKPGDLSTFLAFRDFLKHTWVIVHSHDPRNYVTIHNSGSRLACAYSFCDVWIEGEQFTSWWSSMMSNDPKLTMNDCYPTVLSLDKVRAMFNSRVWSQYLFLSQFWIDERQKEDEYRKAHPGPPVQIPPSMQRRYRYLSGLMRVNDTPLWGELTPALPAYTRMVEWGWDDSIEFIGYWNSKGAFEFSPGESDKVAVSAWYRPDGKLVMCVFNGQKQPVTVNITLHPEKFPVKLRAFTKALDMTTPDPVLEEGKNAPDSFPIQNNALSIPVRAEDYRMLRFDE